MKKGFVVITSLLLLLCSGCSEALKKQNVCTYEDEGNIELRMLYDNDEVIDRVEINYEQTLDEDEVEDISSAQIQKSMNTLFSSVESENIDVSVNYTNRSHTINVRIVMSIENFTQEEEVLVNIKKGIKQDAYVKALKKRGFSCGANDEN